MRTRGWAIVVAPLMFAGLLAAWAWLSYTRSQGQVRETVGMIGVCALSYAVGLAASRLSGIVGPLIAAAVGATFLAADGAFSGHPLAPPLHYENANAALLVQAAAAAGLAAASRNENVRAIGVIGAGGLAAVTIAIGSGAGLATGVMVVVAVVVAAIGQAPEGRHWVMSGLLLVGPPTLTVLIVTRPWLPGLDRAAEVFSERRLALWREAWDLAGSRPLTGTGPGTFARESATAASDLDTQAAHSAALEVAAELGLVGMALLAATVLSAALALRTSVGRQPGAALIGTVAWTALWAHAAIDYVADFPAVMVTACVVVGLAVRPSFPRPGGARASSEQLDVA